METEEKNVMNKIQTAAQKLESYGSDDSLTARADAIHAQLMSEIGEDEEDFRFSYLHLSRLTAMAVAVCEKMCGELSGSDPSEWVMEQQSREGHTRSKEDPRLKSFHSYLQLAGQLIEKSMSFRCKIM